MSRPVVLALAVAAARLPLLTAQEAPPPVPAAAAATPAPAVAPPAPGQLQAAPAPAPSRIPDLPPSPLPAPSVPLRPGATAKASSTSTSGQFIVHGDDLNLRSAFSSKCEEIAAELRVLLRDKQPWAVPVVVLLTTGEAARKAEKPIGTVISQLSHGGFHLQVNVSLRAGLRPSDVRNELVRALLAERILRDHKEITANRELLLPEWLYTGVLEALDFRQRARPSALFAAIFKSGKIFGIEEIIEASPVEMDALSKTIYQTSCCALVLALLDQPEGGMRIAKFLNALAVDPRPERELLNQWFPGFAASPASLNKWWALQMAALASPSMGEPLPPADTVKMLEEALTLRYQARPSEIPAPRPVVAAKPAPAKPAAPAADVAPPAAEAPVEPEKRSFLGWLNPFSRGTARDEEVIEAAIQEAALAEARGSLPEDAPPAPPAALVEMPAESPVAAPSPDGKARQPLFNRWFGKKDGPDGEPVPEPPAPAPAAAAPAVAKSPAPAPKPAPPPVSALKPAGPPPAAPEPAAAAPAPADKPSMFNPFNWFRDSKPAAPVTPPPAEKAKEAAKDQAALPFERLLWVWSPLAGDVLGATLAQRPAAPRSRQVEGFLGLFGRKKAAEPEAPAEGEVKPAAVPPAAEPSKKKKAASAPQAGEPAKPEVKPAAPAPEPAMPTPAEAAPAEKAADMPAAETPEAKPERRGFLWFGRGRKDEPEAPMPEAAPAPLATEAAKVERPAPPAEASPAPVAPTAPKPAAPRPPKPAAKPAENEPLVAAAVPIEDYAAILKRKDRAAILEQNIHQLAALQNRAAVLFRPIIADYGRAFADLREGKTKGLDARLRALRQRSEEALARSKAVRDFLDLHEVNESTAMSGVFDEYLNLPETLRKELPPRSDPIARYLDALDREFAKD